MTQFDLIPRPTTEEQIDAGSSDDRYTPPEILEAVAEFWPDGIDTDPCWSPLSLVRARKTYTIADDGLAQEWEGKVWCNPPFSNPAPWVQRCVDHGSVSLLLCKCDTTTEWFQMVWKADVICFLSKRTRFLKPREGRMGSPEFGCVIAYFGNRFWEYEDDDRFVHHFSHLGKVIKL